MRLLDSYFGLHGLPRRVCRKTYDHYSRPCNWDVLLSDQF